MQRDLSALQNKTFDLVVIGGGITGACLAADAAMRGLSVALVEKNDFGGATSSASSKLLHGGIRYLQQLNFAKVRESARERIYFQQLAPHLTRYIPFIIPTYTGLSKGRFVMRSAMVLYELICSGLNGLLQDAAKRVPGSRMLTRAEVSERVPGIAAERLTGGVAFYESHMYSSERMTLAFVECAVQHGAVAANYLEVKAFTGIEEGRVRGVTVTDRLDNQQFDISATLVVNAAGPWIPVLNQHLEQGMAEHGKNESIVSAYSKGAHIVARPLTRDVAVALPTRKQNQAVINRGGRHVFIIPWRGYSLIGTTYGAFKDDLDNVGATDADIDEMLEDINAAFAEKEGHNVESKALERKDVVHAFAGIYPLVDDVIQNNVYQGTGKYQVVDHGESHRMEGLFSVFGAKYTTARLLAEKALDRIVAKLDREVKPCQTRNCRLPAGDIEDLQAFREAQRRRYGDKLAAEVIDKLVTQYGTHTGDLLDLIETEAELGRALRENGTTLEAQIVYAARNEMACHLEDVIFRRTGLGTVGNPGEAVLLRCATLMGRELGWSPQRIDQEVKQTLSRFPVQQSNV